MVRPENFPGCPATEPGGCTGNPEGAHGTPLWGVILKLGFCAQWNPIDKEDELICRYIMLLINGDFESVLPFGGYDGITAGREGGATSQYHWKAFPKREHEILRQIEMLRSYITDAEGRLDADGTARSLGVRS
eukprot:10864294-Heterocapsa_arctica.AAC.1